VTVSGWISAADYVDFCTADFGWEVKRWYQYSEVVVVNPAVSIPSDRGILPD